MGHGSSRRAGGTLKIRVVKGANLAMERVEAELHGWEQAPYATKAEVDASFKALVESALDERWAGAGARRRGQPQPVRRRVGDGSHRQRNRIELEMLEGMAPAQARRAPQPRRTTCCSTRRSFAATTCAASIAYLTRRLDENTSPENFLRSLFTLRPGSAGVGRPARAVRGGDGDARTTCRQRLVERRIVPATPDRTLPVGAGADRAGSSRSRTPPTPTGRSAANRAWIEAGAGVRRRAVVGARCSTAAADIDAVVATAVGVAGGADAPLDRAAGDCCSRSPTRWSASAVRTLSLMAHDAAQDRGRGRPRGVGGHRLRPLLRAACIASRSRRRTAAARRSTRSVWCWSRRRGTSRTPSRPAVCWPRSRPATRWC